MATAGPLTAFFFFSQVYLRLSGLADPNTSPMAIAPQSPSSPPILVRPSLPSPSPPLYWHLPPVCRFASIKFSVASSSSLSHPKVIVTRERGKNGKLINALVLSLSLSRMHCCCSFAGCGSAAALFFRFWSWSFNL